VFHSPDGSAALDHTSILKTVEPARAHRQGRGRPGRRAQPHRALAVQRERPRRVHPFPRRRPPRL